MSRPINLSIHLQYKSLVGIVSTRRCRWTACNGNPYPAGLKIPATMTGLIASSNVDLDGKKKIRKKWGWPVWRRGVD